MKKLLIHLSILSLLAFVGLPMIACAPAAEEDAEIEVETDDYGDDMDDMGDEMEDMGEEIEEGAEEGMEEIEEGLEEIEEEMEGEEEPPPPAQ